MSQPMCLGLNYEQWLLFSKVHPTSQTKSLGKGLKLACCTELWDRGKQEAGLTDIFRLTRMKDFTKEEELHVVQSRTIATLLAI